MAGICGLPYIKYCDIRTSFDAMGRHYLHNLRIVKAVNIQNQNKHNSHCRDIKAISGSKESRFYVGSAVGGPPSEVTFRVIKNR